MSSAGAERDIAAALAEMWERRRESFVQRAATIESAIASLLGAALTEEERAEAEREAHKLAGSLGTFGLPGGGQLARELEVAFAGGPPVESAPRLAELALALQRDIARGPTAAAPAVRAEPEVAAPAARPGAGEDGEPSEALLVSTDDDALADRLTAEAVARGMAVLRRRDGAAALVGGTEPPGAAVVDLGSAGEVGRTLDVVGELAGGEHPVPVVVLAPGDELMLRVEVARRGGAIFLERAASSAAVIGAVSGVLERRRGARSLVIALDDDPAILDALTALLEPEGIDVTGVDEPGKLWALLSEPGVDLLVLDVDMPSIDGIDLCRVLRSDPRFADMPVVFLTARAEPELLQQLFAAGADDYVAKPIVGPELVGRIRNRIRRARAARELADRDGLTGVATRRRSTADISQALALAERYEHPLSFAVLDVDRFKQFNDRHGHATGDAVLQALGHLLSRAFRREDIVGRWGGEEFVVCLYGARREDAVKRIQALLERFRRVELPTPAGPRVRATFSAGVAEYPADAGDVQALHRAADAALYAAKAAGRDRVLPVGWRPQEGTRVVDVAVVEDDDTLAELLTHALRTRGYVTERIADGLEAAAALGGAEPPLRARLALLDVDLPGLDGLSLLRRLAREGALGELRVIMLTARAAENEVLEALELGATDHVAKPFSVPVLIQRVQRALEGTR